MQLFHAFEQQAYLFVPTEFTVAVFPLKTVAIDSPELIDYLPQNGIPDSLETALIRDRAWMRINEDQKRDLMTLCDKLLGHLERYDASHRPAAQQVGSLRIYFSDCVNILGGHLLDGATRTSAM
jgi:hypothetical protein